ncbi:YihY/virulence factor BrkB family protein [Actinocrinis puniceicyclus]|uniref:YihY/virulence factor BrkB family protein n=1 Tax=Actinocrinis puniceicyclus TaxID=977794 RepID=A0A8J7WPD4_9ACTN|nr:YihY/virulence factor BrkB family protein [Actinocrinis puniceicyclus]MBS2963109.1 YihY/virulence factor BrkB family protein [Actinocrinis puniceicyclus]
MYTDIADEVLRRPRSERSGTVRAEHVHAQSVEARSVEARSVEARSVRAVMAHSAVEDPAAPRQDRERGSLVRTFRLSLRYRITGLAAEAAFWVLLSLPALALGIVGVLGYLHGQLGTARTARLEHVLSTAAGSVLSQRSVRQTVTPALHNMLSSGHADVVSVGFLVALWSGSRALNVAIDTITVASGQSGRRGIVRTRLLAFGLYLPALLLGASMVVLLLVGTELLAGIAPAAAAVLGPLTWPALAAALVVFLSTLYHLALPDRPRWRAGLPGAFVALAMWAAGSALLRVYLHSSQYGATGAAGFGRIAATAAVLLWLYITALAVLIGAVFNAVRAGNSDESADGSGVRGGITDGGWESAGQKAVEPASLSSDNAERL